MAEIYNENSNTLLSGTSGNDYVYNDYGSYVTINTGDGNDSVDNSGGEYVTINTGDGNDSVSNWYAGSDVTINTGAGNDYIENWGERVTISSGKGNDSIYNNWDFEINEPFDDDSGLGENVLFKYNSGDGNDIIYGFRADSTLEIGGGSYSTTKSGNNIIVSVGDGKITLNGAATLDAVNIMGTEGGGETVENSWKLSGTTATYGTAIKITGVKSLDGISLNGNVVTIAASALNASKVTISNGYTLALASNVTKTSTKKAWSLSGTTAKYNQTTSAGYTLASDAKSITYTKAATKTLVTVSGVKATSGLTVSGKVITVSKAALGTSKVTVSGTGYTLALADDVATALNKKAWSKIGTTATYKQTSTAGYTLASDAKSISYSKAATKTLATVKGVKSIRGFTLSGKTIKLATASLSKSVSVSGSYAFEFASNYSNAKITGSASADTIKVSGVGCQVSGGKGNDSLTGGSGADTFIYSSGDGNDVITNFDEADKISLKSGAAKISTSGNDVIFTVGKGKITLKNANGKNITYFESGTEHIYPEKNSGVEYNADGTAATLKTTYTNDEFEPTGTYKDILVTIDAAAVQHSLKINGNKNTNKITGTIDDDTIDGGVGADTISGSAGNDSLYGGKGNDSLSGGAGEDSLWGGEGSDTLFGGAGDDIFIYQNGDGKDIIADFEKGDIAMILSGKVGGYTTSGKDVIFKVGTGQITFKNSTSKYIELVDEEGNSLQHYNPQ